MFAIAEVYEDDIGRVHNGQRARVTSPVLASPLVGTVDWVHCASPSRTRSARTRRHARTLASSRWRCGSTTSAPAGWAHEPPGRGRDRARSRIGRDHGDPARVDAAALPEGAARRCGRGDRVRRSADHDAARVPGRRCSTARSATSRRCATTSRSSPPRPCSSRRPCRSRAGASIRR
jgi:hypothetical protein